MDAVISDIHGNLEAIIAVLERINELGVTRIICLGDLVCYGPNSLECLRHSADWNVLIAGDWDMTMLEHDPTHWNPVINRHIEWVRSQIHSANDVNFLLDTLRSYQRSFVENGRCFTHGTPASFREWIFPEDVYNSTKLNCIAAQFDTACFCGHSHIQGVYSRNANYEWEFVQPRDGDSFVLSSDRKTIIAVGSVGQPRDSDPRAALVTIDGDVVTFHRVAYNVNVTVKNIYSIPEIDNLHGQRLLEGR